MHFGNCACYLCSIQIKRKLLINNFSPSGSRPTGNNMKTQTDILFESINNISTDILAVIGKKWGIIDIKEIKNRLYSAVYFGEIDYTKLLIKYNLL